MRPESSGAKIGNKADSCSESVGTGIQRLYQGGLENCVVVPALLPELINVRFVHVGWSSGELVGESEKCHDIWLDRRGRVVKR